MIKPRKFRANHAPVYAIAYDRVARVFRRVGDEPGDETFPGLLLLRTEGRLTFANVDRARDRMRALAGEPTPEVVVLECSAIPDIEYTALTRLTEAEEDLRDRGIELWLAGVNPDLETDRPVPPWREARSERGDR